MAKLNYIGSSEHLVNYSCNSSIEELCEWFKDKKVVQLDTETNLSDSIVTRKLIAVQFGNVEGTEVFVIQWSFLDQSEKDTVLKLLDNPNILKIAHNASFEYQIFLKEGIVLENIWDTMTMEQCLYAGYDYDLRFFSLASVLLRRYHIDISKEQQGEFGDNIINDEKLIYAATDVLYLGRLYYDQRKDLYEEDLLQLGEGEYNENEAVLAFSDMEYYGMGFNPEKWRENIAKAEPIVKEAKKNLNKILLNHPYIDLGHKLIVKAKLQSPDGKERKVEVPAILPEDKFVINWNSAEQVKEVITMIPKFSDLEKISALKIKEYLQKNDPDAPKTNDKGRKISVTSKIFNEYLKDYSKPNWFILLKFLVNKEYKILEKTLIANFRQQLINRKYLLPKNTVTINWNSNDAKLSVFRWFNPEIENTDKDTVEDNIHMPFFQYYKEYNNANSLLTKYGESFIEKQVDIDGRVRTRFNTILSTGRVSSSSPNVQQIPKNALPKERQKDYRSCFTPGHPDWVIVDADYASQEIAVIATLSQDPVFLDALKTGKDLHSVSAYTVLKDRWKEASAEISGIYPKDENGYDLTDYKCKFFELNENNDIKAAKCKCPQHQFMRQKMKSVTFGLAYGLSPKGLAGDLKIPLEEAEELFELYFKAFPKIKSTLDALANYAVMHGFIRTLAPFRRKRYFPYWKGPDTPRGLLGQIERAAKNMPIQGSSSDMVKISLIEFRRWINKNNLRDKVRLFIQLHDEIAVSCHISMKDTVAKKLKEVMENAATIVLKNNLLKADLEVNETW